MVSGVPQGCVLGPLLFLVYTSELFSLVSNSQVGYASDTSFLGVVPRPSDRTSVTDSFDADLPVISDWCFRWGVKLNTGKTKAMTVFRSRTLEPHFPDLLVNGIQLESVGSWRSLA